MKKWIFMVVLVGWGAVYAQSDAGEFQLGVRSTTSLFSHDSEFGTGAGGQFRIRLLERLNTEWFADYLTSNLNGLGKRTDGHIGWSVMFYPLNPKVRKVEPYFLMGHCFDYTKVNVFESNETAERWSSAFQGGLGMHYHLTERMNLSLGTQYMGHIGKDIHAELHEDGDQNHLHISDEGNGKSLEGHLLVTVSMNVKIADLW